MLYMVASPIGNLADISTRLIETLKNADYIICEDTRQTRKILAHLKISRKLVSMHEHSSDEKLMAIVEDLKSGQEIAYVSDAGTPNLSDPGGKLVQLAYANNIRVSPIPGPSALASLISIAPFSCSDFRFIGFFPKKKGRETLARELKESKYPVFFFESPKRVKKTLHFLADRLPNKKILVGRELTKLFEQIILLDLSLNSVDNIDNIPEKGEFVLAIFD